MPLKDMATSTGAFGFLRTLGGTIGITIGEAIFSTAVKKQVRGVAALQNIDTSPSALSESVPQLKHIAVRLFRSYFLVQLI